MARRMATLTIWHNHIGGNTEEIKNIAVKEYLKQQENELNRFTSSYASISVSYTHLDVYKRQSWLRSAVAKSTPR